MGLRHLSARWVGVFAVLSLSFVSHAWAEKRPGYYGSEFLQGYQNNSLKDQALLLNLFKVLSGGHVANSEGVDTIGDSCGSAIFEGKAKSCKQHTSIGYDGARKLIFGKFYLEEVGGVYGIKDVYCEHTFTAQDFGGKPEIGPGQIPGDGSILNTEHTWPQSRFTNRFNKETQKSDMHHLYPTDSRMNSLRGNIRFGNVAEEAEILKCPIARLGRQKEGGIIFEAPRAHRGNVARSIFYFATRYQMKISASEEAALRQWHTQDPIDQAEMDRNDEIEKAQGNRNPFIDYPDLIDRIDTFR